MHKNEEAYREWYNAWYAANRERINERRRQNRDKIAEYMREYNKKYYERNKARQQELSRLRAQKCYEKNHDKIRQADNERKRIKRAKEKEAKVKSKSPDKRRLPKDYLTAKEEVIFGIPQQHHKKKKLLETCPQGFFQVEQSENPFRLVFD